MALYCLKQRRHILSHRGWIVTRDPQYRRGVHHREIELCFVCAQGIKQIKNLVYHPIGTSTIPIDLVHHHDRIQPSLKCFTRNESSLWHGAIHCVNQKEHRVNHRQNALYLTPEISVPGRVDDIDSVVAPADSGVFGQNRNATLTLLIVRVHDTLGTRHLPIQRTGLLQKAIHQRRFAMVYVSNNGNITKGFHRSLTSVGGEGVFYARGVYTSEHQVVHPISAHP